uniref:Protein kinase domain-containing protein n=1 Tax=Arcella intermedia TaxID=1963864 RepID=A0A6B2LEW5_9EUKA
MTWLSHPFILKLHYCFQTKSKVYMVLDLVTGGDLYYNLRKEESGQFSDERVRFYAAQLVVILEHLHEKRILYRDIKPENLLIKKNGYLILCDFGLAKAEMSKQARTSTFCGTEEYYSPEMILGKEYGLYVDWWQMGTLMYELLTGNLPFYHENEGKMYKLIVEGALEFPDYVNKDTIDIISKLLEKDPQTRLQDPAEIKKHPYFNGINWVKLVKQEIKAPFIPTPINPEEICFVDDQYSDDTNDSELVIDWPGFEYASPN